MKRFSSQARGYPSKFSCKNFPPNFVAGFLRLHNQYRASHESPPLQIDGKLNDYAQEWANVLAEKCALEYRTERKYGENVFRSNWRKTERDIKPADPLESWYREGRFFIYGEEQPQSLEDVRHFTQLLWKDSKTIGLGIANDAEGFIYFVCNYNPPGNVDNQFAKNVLPLKQKDEELLPHEAENIRTTEIRPEVVKSMERLYAVPSEKLRVWSVWLTKIVEIADEWQRWLRAHIDFTLRLADHLYAAELAIRRSKMEIVELKKVSSKVGDADDEEMKYLYDTGDSIQGEVGSIYEEAIDTQEPVEGEEDQRSSARLSARQASSATMTPSTATIKEVSDTVLAPSHVTVVRSASAASKKSSTTTVKSSRSATSRQSSRATVKSAPSATSKKSSKISIRSAPSATSRQSSKISIRSAKSATSRQSSRTSLRSARSKASVKSGNKIAEPRTWPIGIPWEHLGLEDKCDEEEYEKLPLPSNEEEMREFLRNFTHQATIYRSYYKHWKETAERATKQIGGRLVLATFQVQGKDKTGRTKRPVYPKKPCGGVSKGKLAKSNTEQVSAPDQSEKAGSVSSKLSRLFSSKTVKSSKDSKKSQERLDKLDKESQKSIEVPDWVKECARALEPIPYVFYVRAEPDIDIAIEHDDEEVILADLDREGVIAKTRRIFFNLTDKPCKGGKPWI